MKKVWIWILIVIASVAVADLLFGVAMRGYISKYRLKGDYRSVDYLLRESKDELVVLGSSVALNSFNTKMLSDSLGIKAFNAGSNGQCLPYYQSLLEIIAERPELKTLILGVGENNLNDTGLGTRYKLLIPYYDSGYEPIDRRLEGDSRLDKIFYKSSLYRYNTIWFRILLYHFYEPGIKGENGFISKELPPYFPKKQSRRRDFVMSEERSEELDSMVALCKRNDIRLIMCITPKYESRSFRTDVEKKLRQRAARGDFELWFDADTTPLSADSTLFFDDAHLNYRGADIYTSIIIDRLRDDKNNCK